MGALPGFFSHDFHLSTVPNCLFRGKGAIEFDEAVVYHCIWNEKKKKKRDEDHERKRKEKKKKKKEKERT